MQAEKNERFINNASMIIAINVRKIDVYVEVLLAIVAHCIRIPYNSPFQNNYEHRTFNIGFMVHHNKHPVMLECVPISCTKF